MNKNKRLRKLLDEPGIIVAPGVYDGISARIVQKLGFDACYLGGHSSVASNLGLPDIGLATMTEMVDRVHKLSSCIDIPMISDSDNGYGNLNNVRRTVREFEAAGASAIHIEDQKVPKKCGAMDGLELIPLEEAVDKIKIALTSRRDPDFLIIARTDARKASGLDEAIKRVKAYANAGADVVFVEMLENKEEILKVTTSVENAPVMFDNFELAPERLFTAQELEKLGVKIVIYAISATLFAASKLQELYQAIKDTGTTTSFFDQMMLLHDYEKLMGLEEENSIKKLIE